MSKTTAATDVTGVSSAYSSGAGLKVGTSLRSYRDLDGSWAARVVTSKGDTYFVQTSLSDGEVLLILQKPVSGEDEIIECEGLSVARTDHGITATLPARCIRDPWRLRFGVRVSASTSRFAYSDNAFGDGRQTRASGLSSWLNQG